MNKLLAIEGGEPAVLPFTYKRWPFYTEDVERPILERIRNGDIESIKVDPLIEEFEERFTKQYCDGSYGIFCGSGTAALFSAYFALGLDYGAEVLVPTNTFRATVTPLLLLNLRPVLCDSDAVTGGVNLSDAEARITSRTQAMVVTHLWGHPVDMIRARAIASRHGLAIVEDCSHAHGATWDNQPVGTFGDVAAFSLGTKKMISGGTAGILVTKRRDIFERALVFGQPRHRADAQMKLDSLRQYLGSGFGANLRGTPIAAALAINHLQRLPTTISIKNQNLSRLADALQNYLPGIEPPVKQERFTSGAWYMFQCSWNNETVSRDLMLKALQAEGILVAKPGGMLHKEQLFADPSPLTSYRFEQLPLCNPNEYPVSDAIASRLISWHTRELYEPADEVIQSYAHAFQKIHASLDRLETLA